jgi:cystathionine beta-lyase/cystathionine gamma-synthase
MLGVVVGAKEAIRRIRALSSLTGVNTNPFECWLASRGLRTLPLRMERVSETALELAHFLKPHPAVARVYDPGLTEHATYDVAFRLLTKGFGGMLSFDLCGGRPAVAGLFAALKDRIPFSPTLADARTTVSYPAGTSHKFMSPEARHAAGITDGLVRLSVGLEDAKELRHELVQALDAIA